VDYATFDADIFDSSVFETGPAATSGGGSVAFPGSSFRRRKRHKDVVAEIAQVAKTELRAWPESVALDRIEASISAVLAEIDAAQIATLRAKLAARVETIRRQVEAETDDEETLLYLLN